MKKFVWIWLTVLVLFSAVTFIIVFSSNSGEVGISESPGECKTIIDNGVGKIDIVFFSEFSVAEEYVDFFLDTGPYSSRKEDFNFFYIDDFKPICELYKGIILLCHNKEAVKKAASCPNDIIVALEKEDSSIRSSTIQNFISVNTEHPLSVLIHELGHALSNLADEYVDPQAKIPKGAKNCVKECSEFGEGSDCYDGCTKTNYFRSAFEGVMRTLSTAEYGAFNNFLINERIDEEIYESGGLITGKVVGESRDCGMEEYLLVELKRGEGDGEIDIVTERKIGCADGIGDGPDIIEVFDEYGKLIRSENFNRDHLFTVGPGEDDETSGGTFIVEEAVFKIPFNEEAVELQIRDFDGDIVAETKNIDKGGNGNRPLKVS